MSNNIRIRKNLLGENQPITHSKELCDLLKQSYYEKINLRPVYQRHIRWKHSAMNDFIGTIMNNGMVPGIIMYQLTSKEKINKNEKKMYEIVDGQHRLFTLNAFKSSTYQMLPHIKKQFIVYWDYVSYNEMGIPNHSHVFYKETDDVKEWCIHNKIIPDYLTEEEREYFDHFGINITHIKGELSLNHRRDIFMSLQKGVPVRNSDILKNKTDCKVTLFLSENGYEEMMEDVFFKKCHKKSLKYWMHWVCRCFLLYKRFHKQCESDKFVKIMQLPVSEVFLVDDSTIAKLIDCSNQDFNPTDETILCDFDDTFRSYIEFLQRIKEMHKLNPIQLFALFYVLCDVNVDVDIILTHIPYLSRDGSRKSKKTLWESKGEKEECRKYFNKCFHTIRNMTEIADCIDDRIITKKLRNMVWAKCVNNTCEICYDDIDKNTFEAGHIVSRAFGGKTDISNLIPICFHCNRSMGTRHADEYKRDVYPHNVK